MTITSWIRERVLPRLHWGMYLWIALLPFQLQHPLEGILGVRLALSDVALAAVLFAALACWLARSRCAAARPRRLKTSLDCALIGLISAFVMGLVVAWVRTGSLTSYILLNKGAGLLVLCAAFYAMLALLNTPERLRRAAVTLIGSVGIANIISLALYGAWIQWGLRTPVLCGARLSGFLIDPNAWGGLLVVALFLQLGFLAVREARTRWVWAVEITNVLFLLSGVALTRSRSAWLALAIGAMTLAWLSRRLLNWKRVVIACISLGGAGLLAWWLAGDVLFSLAASALTSGSISLRWDQIIGGLRAFRSSPIWGIGLGSYIQLDGTYIIHNTYVWFLAEMGSVGLMAFLCFLIRVGRNLAVSLKTRSEMWGLVVGCAAAFAGMLGFALGIEATYQRHLWFLFALAEGLRRTSRPAVSHDEFRLPSVLFVTTIAETLRAFLIPHMKMLRDRGWRVDVAANYDNDSEIKELAEAGFPVQRVPLHRRVSAVGNLAGLWQLWRLMQARCYDVIHVHTPMAAMIGRVAARMTHPRPAVLYTAHGFHFHRGAHWLNWALFYPAERLAAHWTDGLIVMNEEDLQRGETLGFIKGESLFQVHGVGVDLNLYGGTEDDTWKIRREFGLAADDVLVTCVAEFTRGKNHDLLLDAWHRLAISQVNAHLLLVGRGLRESAVRAMVDSGHYPTVHFAGYREDVPDVLQTTDILVLASQREGLPRCIMEAMAAGKPVVATNVRGSRDLIENHGNGLLVKSDDAEELASALETLIMNQDLRVRMGRCGRQMIEDYAIDRVLDEMWPIYDCVRQIGFERASCFQKLR